MMHRTLLAIAGGLGLALAIQTADAQTTAAPKAVKPKYPELTQKQLEGIQKALPTEATAKPQKARKVLVFYWCEGFVHGDGIVAANKAIQLMGEKTKAFEADLSTNYVDLTEANLAKYDVLILNNTTQLKVTDENKKAILDFIKGGKGIVGIHAATDNFYNWKEGAEMMGGLFDGHPWGGGGTWAFKLDDPNHTLNKAFEGKNFKVKDEVYQFKAPYSRSDRRVLITLDLSDPTTGGVTNGVKRTDKDFAVAWARDFGKGRLFFSNLGHAANIFQEAAILKFYLDGIQWAAGDLKADVSPK